MKITNIALGNNRIEMLTDGNGYLGIGRCWIGDTTGQALVSASAYRLARRCRLRCNP